MRHAAPPEHAYNAPMSPPVRSLLPFLLCCATLPAHGEAAIVKALEPPCCEHRHGKPPHEMPPEAMSPEARAAWREERRQRREQWRQMSPEERRQLRYDIRAAGHELYRQPHRQRD